MTATPMASLPLPADRDREFGFSHADFETIRRLVGEQTGIVLSDAKKDMVYGRLARRLRQLGLPDFASYCRFLEEDDGGEMGELINAITTNLTAFFREGHHFDYLGNVLLPQLMQEKVHERRIRIWSAGCSTGEEPYSIAMVLREVIPANRGWDVRILATDLDSNVLATGRHGVYPEERVRDLPRQRLSRWFQRGGGANQGFVRVKSELRDLISFKRLNLLHPWPFKGPFDLIFCRNVVIYFSKDTQRQLFDRFADMLAPRGHLFIGHSETLFRISERFRLVGNTIYQKNE